MKYCMAALVMLMHCKSIETKIEIEAPPEVVWAEFSDFDKYGEWNPFLRVSGEMKPGSKLAVAFHRSGDDWFKMNPTVLEASNRHLIWRGRLLMPGIFTGEHEFRFEQTEKGQTVFYHNEKFNGLIVPFFPLGDTERKFEAMNAALKKRAEHATRKPK
ncbi:Polyketide cyclase/dehydrase [Turneriella parva DSM 21527]|uniref:Polyketide cyclase/dehydrase n=2 Tax=Turneriella TaxID=338321 RepID=I4B324_TURPD|nr:Polyketide cyclase/dehydrase [Turneriella parva DSM 21527]